MHSITISKAILLLRKWSWIFVVGAKKLKVIWFYISFSRGKKILQHVLQQRMEERKRRTEVIHGQCSRGTAITFKSQSGKKKSQSGKIVQRELILVIYQFQILLILLLNVSFFFPGQNYCFFFFFLMPQAKTTFTLHFLFIYTSKTEKH